MKIGGSGLIGSKLVGRLRAHGHEAVAASCADAPAPQAAWMAATQRPVTRAALTEPSGAQPLWRERPSWFLIADQDRNIPAALQRFMAKRAGARRALELPGASHAVAVSQPEATVQLILAAAQQHAAARQQAAD